jgi:hypothetical protein
MAEELYGLDSNEQLVESTDEIVERVLDDAVEKVDESFDVIADRIKWPVKVGVYRRMTINQKLKDRLAMDILDDVLDRLDEDLANPNGSGTEPTAAMCDAAKALVDVIAKDYQPWACEPTGAVVEISREQARKSDHC